MKRLWIWLFGPEGSGFVELLVFTFVALLALVSIVFMVAFVWTLAAPLLGFS